MEGYHLDSSDMHIPGWEVWSEMFSRLDGDLQSMRASPDQGPDDCSRATPVPSAPSRCFRSSTGLDSPEAAEEQEDSNLLEFSTVPQAQGVTAEAEKLSQVGGSVCQNMGSGNDQVSLLYHRAAGKRLNEFRIGSIRSKS